MRSLRLVSLLLLALDLVCPVLGQEKDKAGDLVQCTDSARLRYQGILGSNEDQEDRPTPDPLKKALIVGHVGLGLGNYLISFPSAYNFAVSTGRDIVLADATLIGEFCNIVVCGFHSYSYWIIKNELLIKTQQNLREKKEKEKGQRRLQDQPPPEAQQQQQQQPQPKKRVKQEKTDGQKPGVPSLRASDFLTHFKGNYPLSGYQAIHVYGYLHKTNWFWELEDLENKHPEEFKGKEKYAGRITSCLEKVSRCRQVNENLSCIDRFALQQLVVGPFINDVSTGKRDGMGSSDRALSMDYLEKNTVNMPSDIADALLYKKLVDAPRIDVSVHLRNMFHFFEESTEDNDGSKADEEVSAWLSSTKANQGVAIFRELEKMILNVTTSSPKYKRDACNSWTVFVSADNVKIKEAFAEFLEARDPCKARRVLSEDEHEEEDDERKEKTERRRRLREEAVPAAVGAVKNKSARNNTSAPISTIAEGQKTDIAKAAVGPSISISGKGKSNEDDKKNPRRPPSPSPTKRPSHGLFKTKRNPERANFVVIRTLQGVYHSRQLEALHRHGSARCVSTLLFHFLLLSI